MNAYAIRERIRARDFGAMIDYTKKPKKDELFTFTRSSKDTYSIGEDLYLRGVGISYRYMLV